MKFIKAHVARIAKIFTAIGLISLTAFAVLVFIPGEQGEFWFFLIGLQLVLSMAVGYYRILQFNGENVLREGRQDACGPGV